MQAHIDRAIKESCPFFRETCVMAALGACAAVEVWREEHRAMPWTWVPPYDLYPAQRARRIGAGRRGGSNKAQRDRLEAMFG